MIRPHAAVDWGAHRWLGPDCGHGIECARLDWATQTSWGSEVDRKCSSGYVSVVLP